MNRSRFLVFCVTLILLVTYNSAYAQISTIDSLKVILSKVKDTLKVKTLIDIGSEYKDQYLYDDAFSYDLEALKLAEEIQNNESIFLSLMEISNLFERKRDHGQALEYALRAKKVAENQNNKQNLYDILGWIGGMIYFNQGNYGKSVEYINMMLKIAMELNDKEKILNAQINIGDTYRAARKSDSAFEIYTKALKTSQEFGDKQKTVSLIHGLGMIREDQLKFNDAITYYLESIKMAESDGLSTANYTLNIANCYFKMKKYKEALFYAKKSLESYKGYKQQELYLYELFSNIYAASNNYKEAYNYLIQYNILNSVLNSTAQQDKINNLQNTYKSEKQTKEIDFLNKQNELQSQIRNALIAGFVLIIIIALLIANKYRQKKKSEIALGAKNTELSLTLNDLKSTQSQLIQSEKMASLGELTAGIAHEIQNPLNFVNNFSEVNKELIDELKNELNAGNNEEAISIAKNIAENEQKINHHGKRADAIVKGMLQHSRVHTGEKQLTDINALTDEYLRISYHGFRANDKSFNATIQTNFDAGLSSDEEKINIIPQDIGRVLLNLYNNAFYAVAEKNKTLQNSYTPTVSVSTKKLNDKSDSYRIEIKVKDNGNGIPQKVIDKIFQPFFTTKPTGQGTGLGLSLSYDIIKAHGGEIKVETKEGESAEFVIQLPV